MLASAVPAQAGFWDFLSVFSAQTFSVACTETFIDEVEFTGKYYFRCPSSVDGCEYEITCREEFYPYVDGEWNFGGVGESESGTETKIQCRKASTGTYTGGTVKYYYVDCITTDDPIIPGLEIEARDYYSTSEDVTIAVSTRNIEENTALTASIGSDYRTAVVSNSRASFNFGRMGRGDHTFSVSYSGADASEIIHVYDAFKEFMLTAASYDQSTQNEIVARLRVTDSAGVGLSLIRGEVSLLVTARYNDGSSAGSVTIEDLGNGDYNIRVRAADPGYINFRVIASKSGYVADEKTITIKATSSNIFIDISKLPETATLGETVNLVVTTRTPVDRRLVDADYLTMEILHPDGFTADDYDKTDMIKEGVGTYSLRYTFSELTSGVELYTVTVVADALQSERLGRNNVEHGISVGSGAGQPVLPPGEEVECNGIMLFNMCMGIDPAGIVILIVIIGAAAKVAGLW